MAHNSRLLLELTDLRERVTHSSNLASPAAAPWAETSSRFYTPARHLASAPAGAAAASTPSSFVNGATGSAAAAGHTDTRSGARVTTVSRFQVPISPASPENELESTR